MNIGAPLPPTSRSFWVRCKAPMLFVLSALVILILLVVGFYFWASGTTILSHRYAQIITLPDTVPPPAEPKSEFTLMTYNSGYFSGMTNNLPVRPQRALFEKNSDTFIQHFQHHSPDFILFQEIDFFSHRSYYMDQLNLLMTQLHYSYAAKAINWDKRYVPFPYWPPAVQFGRILAGQVVVSRYPILFHQPIVLPKPQRNPFYYNTFYINRLIQVVKIEIGTHTLVLLNVHLEAFDQETRQIQAQKVLEVYRSYKDQYPVIVAGDFNAVSASAPQKNKFVDEPEADYSTDRTIDMFLNEPGMQCAYPNGTPFTFPANAPTRQLDYIFYNTHKITSLQAQVLTLDSSDHLPLIMRFKLVTP